MTSDIVLRSCAAGDIPRVLDLWQRAGVELGITDTAQELARLLADSPATLIVAIQDVELVGSVIAAWDGWRGNIYRLAVAPDIRRDRKSTRLNSSHRL